MRDVATIRGKSFKKFIDNFCAKCKKGTIKCDIRDEIGWYGEANEVTADISGKYLRYIVCDGFDKEDKVKEKA